MCLCSGYHETIGPMKESAVWVEEAPLQTLAWGRRSLSPTSYQQEDPLGLSVEENEYAFNIFILLEICILCSHNSKQSSFVTVRSFQKMTYMNCFLRAQVIWCQSSS